MTVARLELPCCGNCKYYDTGQNCDRTSIKMDRRLICGEYVKAERADQRLTRGKDGNK